MIQTTKLFLLGGHDLEMLTIRNVLNTNGYTYIDHQLQWNNAKLSSYKEDIRIFEEKHEGGSIYGIELENDLLLNSKFYRSIDHHNDQSNLPSALEQVLFLLEIPMNREYRLIAANDKAYIPGMLAIGATDEEIRNIRFADRCAQGITHEDEFLAEKAIAENMKREKDLIIVRALNSRFSPICDRLYPYRALLVYTSTEWMFYGIGAYRVLSLFEDEFRKGSIFYGGGIDGYVGSREHFYTEKEIHKMINMIENEFV